MTGYPGMFNEDSDAERNAAQVRARALNHRCDCGHSYHRHEHGRPTFVEDIDESCRDCDCEQYTP